jgi:hypothetical protein
MKSKKQDQIINVSNKCKEFYINQYVRLTDDWVRIIDLRLNAHKTVIMSRTHTQFDNWTKCEISVFSRGFKIAWLYKIALTRYLFLKIVSYLFKT